MGPTHLVLESTIGMAHGRTICDQPINGNTLYEVETRARYYGPAVCPRCIDASRTAFKRLSFIS